MVNVVISGAHLHMHQQTITVLQIYHAYSCEQIRPYEAISMGAYVRRPQVYDCQCNIFFWKLRSFLLIIEYSDDKKKALSQHKISMLQLGNVIYIYYNERNQTLKNFKYNTEYIQVSAVFQEARIRGPQTTTLLMRKSHT